MKRESNSRFSGNEVSYANSLFNITGREHAVSYTSLPESFDSIPFPYKVTPGASSKHGDADGCGLAGVGMRNGVFFLIC